MTISGVHGFMSFTASKTKDWPSVAKCRGSRVVGRGFGSWVWVWVWVWVIVVGEKSLQKKILFLI